VLLGAQINVEVAVRSLKAQEAAEQARNAQIPAEPGRASEFGQRVARRLEEELERRLDRRPENAVEPAESSDTGEPTYPTAPPAGGGRSGEPSARSVTSTGSSARWLGGSARSRAIAAAMIDRSSTRIDH